MPARPAFEPPPSGLRGVLESLRAGISAGSVCGLAFGLLDGSVAAAIGTNHLGIGALVGCLAAAVFQYSFVWIAILAVVALVLHPLLLRRTLAERYLRLLRIGFALGLFCEVYWWTRSYVFYGHSSISPERLAATAAMFAIAVALGIFVARTIVRLPSTVQLTITMAIATCWTAGGVFLLAQHNAGAERGTLNERNRDVPNVLLVVVDALRQDVIGSYGNERVATPHIDELAKAGVLFENAFVQVPFTWTSFGSILTGKYPRRHGLVKMKAGVSMPPNITLAMHLKSARKKDGQDLEDGDYVTATFHTGTLTAGSGLLGGFDMRFEATAGHELVVLDSPWSVFHADLLISIFRNKISQRFDSGIVATAAKKWLAENSRKRFMTMVHLYSTHTPYDPPAQYKKRYVDPQYAGPIRAFYAERREAIENGKYDPTQADLEQIRNLYYAGVTQADDLIGSLVAELARSGVLDDTLVIVTSDHGESLGEQGLLEHNHMVQTNLRVPLVMRWPHGLPAGRRVAARTDEIDILPTICDLLRIELPNDPSEFGKIDGTSLVPVARAEKESVREFSFAENGTHLAVQDGRSKLIVRRACLGDQAWKDALAGKGEKPRLYDLAADPAENANLVDARPEEAQRLYAALRELERDDADPVARARALRSRHRDRPPKLEEARLRGRHRRRGRRARARGRTRASGR